MSILQCFRKTKTIHHCSELCYCRHRMARSSFKNADAWFYWSRRGPDTGIFKAPPVVLMRRQPENLWNNLASVSSLSLSAHLSRKSDSTTPCKLHRYFTKWPDWSTHHISLSVKPTYTTTPPAAFKFIFVPVSPRRCLCPHFIENVEASRVSIALLPQT